MYSATMKYIFKPEGFEEGCRLWKEIILDKAARAEGMVRMQFLQSSPAVLAIGTWKEKSYAEAFMQTGVFRDLKQKIEPLLAEDPQPDHWDAAEYLEGPAAE
jgi:quinol monooxygenase YgiN